MNLDSLISGADRCVKCGLCLPHCPTYHLTSLESESPRGRISLIHALASGQISPSPNLTQALEHCLSCAACEKVCPALVSYTRLHDAALELIRNNNGTYYRSKYQTILSYLVTKNKFLNLMHNIIRGYQKLNLGKNRVFRTWLNKSGLASLEQLCPELPIKTKWQNEYTVKNEIGRVGLFLGCIAQVFDQQTLTDSIKVLNRLGYSVTVPKAQVCCGALHAHQGGLNTGRQLALQNIQAFKASGVDTVIFTASGCGAHLHQYQQMLDETNFPFRFVEICRFLLDRTKIAETEFISLRKRIAVHEPCTLKNIIRDARAVKQLIALIPGVKIIALKNNNFCCGAAGIKMITQPETSDPLLQLVMLELSQLNADLLMTTNIGCALHLLSGCKKNALPFSPIHPISLIRKQWQT